MDTEVSPVVRDFIDHKRASGPKLRTIERIASLGVTDAQSKRYDYAWTGTGNLVISTIWAESVHVHNNSRWYYVESLDIQTRLGGAARIAVQEERARNKLELLKRVHDAKLSFIALLQINGVPRGDLQQKHASIAVQVRDDTEWRVARWDTSRERAILVRGLADWCPSDAEVDVAGSNSFAG